MVSKWHWESLNLNSPNRHYAFLLICLYSCDFLHVQLCNVFSPYIFTLKSYSSFKTHIKCHFFLGVCPDVSNQWCLPSIWAATHWYMPGVSEWWACPLSSSSLGLVALWGQWPRLGRIFTPVLNTNPGVFQMLSVEMNCPINKQRRCNTSVGKIMARSPYFTVPVPYLEIMVFCLATKQLNMTQRRKGCLTERLASDLQYLVCTYEQTSMLS